MKQIVSRFALPQIYDWLFFVALFFLTNRRAIVCWYVVSFDYYCEYGNALWDYILWGMVVLVACLLAIRKGKLFVYWSAWKANWPLALFILYSIASLGWSIVVGRSIHAVYLMLMVSLSGGFLAVLYSPKQLLKALLLFVTVTGLISMAIVFLFPEIGIHQESYLFGNWRGVFTHKNYLGSVMAFGNGLSLIAIALSTRKQELILKVIIYVFTLFLIVMSRSATGFILWAVLNGLCILFLVWKKWHLKLKKVNYIYLISLLAVGLILGTITIFVVFPFMGKNLSLTGRVPVWQVLLNNVVAQRPWFGYGLETLWYFQGFQIWVAKAAGWGIPVVNGHSGYMDMLIELGLVGLALLSIVFTGGLLKTFRRALDTSTWLNLLPFLILAYILITNITISYFLEFESFHWLMLIMTLFLVSGEPSLEVAATE